MNNKAACMEFRVLYPLSAKTMENEKHEKNGKAFSKQHRTASAGS